jgi:hypothetical protein
MGSPWSLFKALNEVQRPPMRDVGRVRLLSDLMPAILFVLADCGGGQPAGAARLLLDAAACGQRGRVGA